MKTIKATIWIDSGSEFQKSVIDELLELTLKAIKLSHESRHKKNTVDYAIEEE